MRKHRHRYVQVHVAKASPAVIQCRLRTVELVLVIEHHRVQRRNVVFRDSSEFSPVAQRRYHWRLHRLLQVAVMHQPWTHHCYRILQYTRIASKNSPNDQNLPYVSSIICIVIQYLLRLSSLQKPQAPIVPPRPASSIIPVLNLDR